MPCFRRVVCGPAPCLGNAGEEFELALYSAASDLFDVLVHNEPYDAFADIRGRILTLTFEAAATAGAAAVRESRLHRWELAGPAAYPVLITVNTPGGGAARADVEDMIALLHAVPAFVQQHGPVLRREDATGAPAAIDWADPASGIVFHYAGEAVLVEDDDDTDEAREDSLLEQHDEIRAALTEAVREAQAEIGEDAPEKALLDAINRSLRQKMTALNDRPQAELGGLAPAQLTRLLRSDWVDPDGAVRIRADLTADDVAHARLLDHARTLLELAIERGKLRATQAGNLKLDIVHELRERMRFDDDEVAELRSANRRITEQDARPLHQIRVVCDLAGLLRRRGNYFEPTQQARSLIEPAAAGELFALLFRTWFRKFNMEYGTRVEWPELQYQIAYTLYRLPFIASD